MAELQAARIPVVVINGFLGAGKTTLVNRLLSDAGGRRIFVFVNDFGELNIDASLIESVEADRISLKDGCVCCSLNEDLVASVANVARRGPAPDMILIEASGVSDPRSIATSLTVLEDAGLVRLDTVAYVLDPTTFYALPNELVEELIDHAAASDIVLLNKADIADSQVLCDLRSDLKVSAPYSVILATTHCDIPIAVLLPSEENAQTRNYRNWGAATHHHNERHASWSIETDDPLTREAFGDFAQGLPSHCLRAKGVLQFAETPGVPHVFHLVGHRMSLEKRSRLSAIGKSSLVAIGLADSFDQRALEESFLKLTTFKDSR